MLVAAWNSHQHLRVSPDQQQAASYLAVLGARSSTPSQSYGCSLIHLPAPSVLSRAAHLNPLQVGWAKGEQGAGAPLWEGMLVGRAGLAWKGLRAGGREKSSSNGRNMQGEWGKADKRKTRAGILGEQYEG